MAYLSNEPHGENRADMRMAILAATIHNVQSKRKLKPSEFLPRYGKTQPQTPEQAQRVMHTVMARHNSSIGAKKSPPQ